VFDVISKRRWFYLLSLIITVPGLFFILLTPVTDAGLQFTIDYTGGTRWEIRFQDPNVTPDQVEAVFAQQGLQAVAVTTGGGFIEVKTEQIAGLIDLTPTPSAGPSGSPAAFLRSVSCASQISRLMSLFIQLRTSSLSVSSNLSPTGSSAVSLSESLAASTRISVP